MNKAYKFRIYPNPQQQILFTKTFGCVRFIYNRMLADKIMHYEKTGQKLNITPAQYKKEFEWLNEVDSLALSNAQINLQSAYNHFFRSPKVGFPKFKSKKSPHRSYTTNCINGNIRLENGYIKLPKAGEIKIRQHRDIPSDYRLKSVTVSQTPSGKYYASILFEYEIQVQMINPQTFLGLDYSMHELYRDSNGNEPQYPRYYRQAEQRLKREQRRLSLMQKGSKNRDRQRIKVAKLHEKVANQRKDFLHKQSRQIANAYDCVCIEDLDMKVMSQNLNFGKSVSDNGWGMFVTFLKYKLEGMGKSLVKVDRFFASSQTCSVCGYRNPVTKNLSVREWDCPQCGTHHDRDTNAATNIRNEGMRIILA
ncbi:IS200/IS605 family element RNA-guided endonuclease TnpB [Thomasclavelia sp.]|uniref:IS200/IS605 family element RNA-guided endonuclease TnpB n=1 Tax=Thomasclavelia sp. TaxID=3025757 RepID=UPI0025F402F7|nr:IS200/IS605 family element RNA-guided endonuclease TnpB [Thomasclavelia sp.]